MQIGKIRKSNLRARQNGNLSFSVKTISRGAGRSAVACSAYRSGEKLIDEQGKEQDYTRKTGVEFTKIYAPENVNLSYSTAITFGTRLKKLNVEKTQI